MSTSPLIDWWTPNDPSVRDLYEMFSGSMADSSDRKPDGLTAMTSGRRPGSRWMAFLVLMDGDVTFVAKARQEDVEIPLEAGECILVDTAHYALADDCNILLLAEGLDDLVSHGGAEEALSAAIVHLAEQPGDRIDLYRYDRQNAPDLPTMQ